MPRQFLLLKTALNYILASGSCICTTFWCVPEEDPCSWWTGKAKSIKIYWVFFTTEVAPEFAVYTAQKSKVFH